MELQRPQWLSIKDAARYLDVGEPTIYRWMRENKITYRKIGDSTRFLQEDLDAMVQVFPSARDAEPARQLCPVCHSNDLVPGTVRSTERCYFRPVKAKFWTWRIADIITTARMCSRCGAVTWFADPNALAELREGGIAHEGIVEVADAEPEG